MIHQTKEVIKMLKQAGYQRSEFRVRTPKNAAGEYGMPQITVLASKEVQMQKLAAVIRAGLGVTLLVTSTGHVCYPIYTYEHSRLDIRTFKLAR